MDAKLRLLADLEIIDVIKSDLNDERDNLIDMNEIQDTYVKILIGRGYTVPEKPAFKKYLNKLILDNIIFLNVKTNQSKLCPPEPYAIKNSVDMADITNYYGVISEAAKFYSMK